jgi:glucokinase
MPVISLDLGGTKLASAIISPTGRVIRHNVVLLKSRRGNAVGRLVCDEILMLLRYAREQKFRIHAISVCVPGISYKVSGNVWVPNISGWNNYPLKREIQSALRKVGSSYRNLPVHIASDRSCCILGEAWRGNAKGSSNAIFLAVGTGIGAGIMVDDSVLEGAFGVAGAIGWMALDRPFLSQYNTCGCFEYHASGAALTNAAKKILTLGAAPSSIFTAAEAGNLQTKKVIAVAIKYWGMAVANLVSIFNPEVIIFGGGVFGPATKFIPAIYKEAKKWAQPIAIKQVKLKPSKLGPDAALFGAAYFALNRAPDRTA